MKAGFIFIFVNHKEQPYCLMMNSIVDKKGLHCFGGRLAYPVIRNWHMSCELFWYLAYLCNMVLCLLKEYLYSQGYKLIFHDLSMAWCHRLTSDTCSVNSKPGPGTTGLTLQCHKITTVPELYSYCFDVGTTPTTQTCQNYAIGPTADYDTCVGVLKNTQYGETNPLPTIRYTHSSTTQPT